MKNIHTSLNKIEYVMTTIEYNLCNNMTSCVYSPLRVIKTPPEKANIDTGTGGNTIVSANAIIVKSCAMNNVFMNPHINSFNTRRVGVISMIVGSSSYMCAKHMDLSGLRTNFHMFPIVKYRVYFLTGPRTTSGDKYFVRTFGGWSISNSSVASLPANSMIAFLPPG